MAKVLLATPEDQLAQITARALSASRFVVESVADGEQAEAWAKVNEYAAVVLDHDLPRCSGLDVCRSLREHDARTPIILLGRQQHRSRLIQALDIGADDFLVSPYPAAELAARIRAVMRRLHIMRRPMLSAGSLSFDQAQRKILQHGKELDLTNKEFSLLEALIRRAGQVVSRGELVEAAWCDTLDAMLSHRLENHICLLRKKLDDPNLIRAHAGRGYELVKP